MRVAGRPAGIAYASEMTPMASRATEIMDGYYRRTGQPRDHELDGQFYYHRQLLRRLLADLEAILEDEEVPPEITVRVIRAMVYGSPDPGEAEQRMRHHDEMVKLLARVPPAVITFPNGQGLPRRT